MSRTACDAVTPHCEFCERPMTTIEHEFCDICDECRDYIAFISKEIEEYE